MGLHLCYELHAPPEPVESAVADRIANLRVRALDHPFRAVSKLVRLEDKQLTHAPRLRGLAFRRLEHVVHFGALSAREDLYRRHIGMAEDDYSRVRIPEDFPVLAIGFAVAPGDGCEPAAFGLAMSRAASTPGWTWHYCCKTQYASAYGDDNMLRCHGSLVAVLDAARALGFAVVVRDETGYWDSRDQQDLLKRVGEMNRIVARFAGAFVDQVRDAGADSQQVQGTIFKYPDFERLETRD